MGADENFRVYETLKQKGIPTERFSYDNTRVNKYGKKLIELCKRCSICIANGRLGKDKYIGKTTCKDASLVDYLLLSPNLFDYISDFEIIDFDPMFSDVHNRIHCVIDFAHSETMHTNADQNKNDVNTHVKWNPQRAPEFEQVLGDDTDEVLLHVNGVLDSLNVDDVTSEQINDILKDIGDSLTKTALHVFGPRKKTKYKSCSNKPWFNYDCKVKRDAFHKARDRYTKSKNTENKNSMNTLAKEYRKVLNVSFKAHREKCSNELRSLSKSDTKGFWKTLHKFSRKQKENPDIDLDTFYEYFKKLNAGEIDMSEDEDSVNVFDINDICDNPIYDEILNGVITEQEIREAIQILKNNKAPGTDKILNEYLKNSPPYLVSIYCKLFNLVLDTGIIPESWTSGIIKPVFKNKGCPTDPDNFRAITLISCLGKLFTSILNSRLNIFANEFNVISENQAGFRKGYSTQDNIFVLHALIELYFSFGKKLFCTFVDFRKAFDTVWRSGLWIKLQKSEIKGKCFKVIYNMYNGIKSCVQYNGCESEFFPCLTGVRQGENLSPFLFSIFFNDLEDYFCQLDGIPLEKLKEKLESELHIFYKIFVILYADDTVILAESKEGLQKALDIFESYCNTWKLQVNVNKTKVIIFCKRKVKQDIYFTIQGQVLDIVDTYSYLGVIFKYNGTFLETRKKLLEQAEKALFPIYKLIRNESLSVDIQLKLFDSMIEPILLYGAEIWGYENIKLIEQFHLKFCKRILSVRNTTPNFMVLGELGRFPLEIKVKLRMVSFWIKLLQKESKLSSTLYRLMLSLGIKTHYTFKWVKYVESIFNDIGMGYIFQNQIAYADRSLIKQILSDQFVQKWFGDIENSSRGLFYSTFKKNFCLENYLLRLGENNRLWLTKLRTSNLRLPIETGRWYNIPREDRICNLCNSGFGDEFHILFVCKHDVVVRLRNKYIPRYYTNFPNATKFEGLLSICNTELYKKLSLFIRKVVYILQLVLFIF